MRERNSPLYVNLFLCYKASFRCVTSSNCDSNVTILRYAFRSEITVTFNKAARCFLPLKSIRCVMNYDRHIYKRSPGTKRLLERSQNLDQSAWGALGSPHIAYLLTEHVAYNRLNIDVSHIIGNIRFPLCGMEISFSWNNDCNKDLLLHIVGY